MIYDVLCIILFGHNPYTWIMTVRVHGIRGNFRIRIYRGDLLNEKLSTSGYTLRTQNRRNQIQCTRLVVVSFVDFSLVSSCFTELPCLLCIRCMPAVRPFCKIIFTQSAYLIHAHDSLCPFNTSSSECKQDLNLLTNYVNL